MANLLQLPSSKEDDALVALADWVELTAFFSDKKSASKEDLKVALKRMPSDDDDAPRVRRIADEAVEVKVNDVFSELSDRVSSCANVDQNAPTYPFLLDTAQSVLSMPSPEPAGRNMVYMFLLGITVASMASTARKLAGHDPTKIFERLSADVLRSFWGGRSAHSDVMIFGTAATADTSQRKFKANIDALCSYLGEGAGWNEDALAPGGGDGSLDLVAWRRFQDKRQGALVGFAQCKTGTHWRTHVTELVPSAFSRDFMKKQLVLDPMRLYMVPSRISRHRWVSVTGKGGLLLDRCRMVQYATDVDTGVIQACESWFGALCEGQKTLMQAITS